MQFEDGPQLPLTPRKKVLVGVGAAMFIAQVAAAAAIAPLITGEDNAHPYLLAALWGAAVAWSVLAALLLVRQADLPDIATASFIVTISAFAAFTLSAALHARGSRAEVNVVDALFLGVTGGALTALLVWGIAMGVARLLRLPNTEALRAAE